jgi:predicted deacetylase
MSMSPAIIAIALELARACFSDVYEEFENWSGRTYMPVQLEWDFDVISDAWDTPNLHDYTIVQLGMLADLQIEADADYWLTQEIKEATRLAMHEKLIRQTIDMGAGDRKTAERWLRQA